MSVSVVKGYLRNGGGKNILAIQRMHKPPELFSSCCCHMCRIRISVFKPTPPPRPPTTLACRHNLTPDPVTHRFTALSIFCNCCSSGIYAYFSSPHFECVLAIILADQSNNNNVLAALLVDVASLCWNAAINDCCLLQIRSQGRTWCPVA